MRREENYTVPVISGFTPINQLPSSSAQGEPPDSSDGIGSEATKKSQSKVAEKLPAKEKKRKAPTSSKPAPPKKPRKLRTIERSWKHDISKDLQRTKPRRESHDNLTGQSSKSNTDRTLLVGSGVGSKLSTILDDPFREHSEAISNNQRIYDTNLLTNNPRPSLVEKYQAAHDVRLLAEGSDSSPPQSFQISSDAGFGSPGDVIRHENDESLQRITQGVHKHSIASQEFGSWEYPLPYDFEPPLSAQPPRATFEEPLVTAVLEKDDLIEHSSPEDDYSLDDAFFEDVDELMRIKQGHESTVRQEPEVLGGTIQNEGFEDDFDGWPGDISVPESIAIYDDGTHRENEAKHSSRPTELTPILTLVSGNVTRSAQTQLQSSPGSKNDFSDFDDSDLESSLVHLTSQKETQQLSTPRTSPHQSSSPKLQWLAPKTFTPTKPPPSIPVRQMNVPHLVPIDTAGIHLPFARPPFPKSVLDRSPILGLSNATVLRTCFRIGEALSAAMQASRSNVDAIIELYARVSASSRESNGGFKHYFQFADLFTDRPPYLSGTSTIWKGVGLWDQDSKVFLGQAGQGKMCRAMGRIKKRKEQAGGCEMTVLSIWEVNWEDVGIAKGVVCT